MAAGYGVNRFQFSDPFSKFSMNRTTRYREKRRRLAGPEAGGVGCSMEVGVEDEYELSDLCLHVENGEEDGVTDSEDVGDTDLARDSDESECEETVYRSEEFYQVNYESTDNERENEEEVSSDSMADKPLYDGATISAQSSSVLIMEFVMRHNLSNECLRDLLQLIKLHCPKPNECITSPYIFKKMFHKKSAIFHYYCSACYETVDREDNVCGNCATSLSSNPAYFIEEPIIPQLQELLQSKFMCSHICTGM